ncbi:hypothetical protein MJO29_004673, partial [Puccinia striiformis f. sp. tritici]
MKNNIGPPIPKIPPPPEPEYSSEHERQHCKKWQDLIAEGLWTQYMETLQDRLLPLVVFLRLSTNFAFIFPLAINTRTLGL